MGTPGFAVPTLDILVKSGYDIPAVITAPDKPKGRGQILSFSPVKEYALQHNLKILQPANLKDVGFISELKTLQSDLFIVVAFRMLPEVVWKMPALGTFNLHASLLPQYRGAAPINWAIINGETETGATTFYIDEKIDTGRVLHSEKLRIQYDETAGELHDRLMIAGANLVLKTVEGIENGSCKPVSQAKSISRSSNLKPAPKIFKEDCRIDWNRNVAEVFNLVRGLSPYPAAFSYLKSSGNEKLLIKIFKVKPKVIETTYTTERDLIPGSLLTDQRNYLDVACNDGLLSLEDIQIEGKRRMKTSEFLRGFHFENEEWRFD
jgi:methionyl-tRNA formyltransferase